jgi:predicted AlkP superfamily pyrophosphatase or phosphodiesterase
MRSIAVSFFILFSLLLKAQPVNRPKLVVGIVVDQMKYDYIYRYWNKLGNDGLKRLVREGYQCANTRYNYAPTVTGPGHASIYTGATPAVHGIIGNDWYDRASHKNVYCVEDSSTKSVGTETRSVGNMSPSNLLTNTVGDELKLATNFNSKVVGIAMKDRGAILPAGHAADGAYWFDPKTGRWISSSHYMTQLPSWVNTFNDLKYPEKYINMSWNTLYDISTYTESTADDTPYETAYKGETAPVFPHDFSKMKSKDYYENVRRSPFGNTLTKDFAKSAIVGEGLGTDEFPDLLCVSFSSTDYIGHQFGTNAVETEDCYLRLDKDLEDFLQFLDKTLGKKNVLLFLTADHGAVQNPQFLLDHKFNAGFFNERLVTRTARQFLQLNYNDSGLFEAMNEQCIYLNHGLIESRKLSIEVVAADLANELSRLPGIADVYSSSALNSGGGGQKTLSLLQMGYNQRRSGDVFYTLLPNYIESASTKGTTHGAPYAYDTHVPLFFWGFTVNPGESTSPVKITEIAPTLSSLLKIEFPNGCLSNPIDLRASK